MDTAPETKRFPVVGSGASVGGLEALTHLLQHLPPDTGMGFVLVQHLNPGHPSALTYLLARTTSMSVLEITDKLRVEPNHVYVIPPNAIIVMAEGRLRLQKLQAKGGAQRAIDISSNPSRRTSANVPSASSSPAPPPTGPWAWKPSRLKGASPSPRTLRPNTIPCPAAPSLPAVWTLCYPHDGAGTRPDRPPPLSEKRSPVQAVVRHPPDG